MARVTSFQAILKLYLKCVPDTICGWPENEAMLHRHKIYLVEYTLDIRQSRTHFSCTTMMQFCTYVLGVSDNTDATTVHSSHAHWIGSPLANVSDDEVCCGVVRCTGILEWVSRQTVEDDIPLHWCHNLWFNLWELEGKGIFAICCMGGPKYHFMPHLPY